MLGEEGEVLQRGATDQEGRFDLPRPAGASKLAFWTKGRSGSSEIAVTNDQYGEKAYHFEVPLGDGELDVVSRDNRADELAGAFHILDTMSNGLAVAERWTGRQMPSIFVYWGRGITTNWSFYRGELPSGSGRYSFELLGGDAGRQSTSDTDEHDEAIILHELGHMVMDLVSTSSSMGGRHPPGVLVDPGLAWEEGRVSWFAVAALRNPHYRDTIGIAPLGKLRVDRDYSWINPGPQGIGSEQTVGEVLWDLSDGVEELVDDGDGDGVALGPAALLAAMIEMSRVDGSYPCLSSFLRFLVTSGRLNEIEVKTMLERSGQSSSLLPSGDGPQWPTDLSLPATVEGEIDGLSDPAPSGGPANPSTGFDAVRAYRVQLSAAALLEVLLAIRGSGRSEDQTDLDLEVRDHDARLLATSRGETANEVLSLPLQPGWYIISVRDGGAGNSARYSLSVASSPLGSR